MFGKPTQEKLQKRLYKAIENHDFTKIKSLVEEGAQVDTVLAGKNAYYTPLYAAVSYDFSEAAHFFLERGARVGHARPYDGQTMLMRAALYGSYSTVEKLLDAGEDIHAAQTDDGKTALHLAAERGRGDVVKLLMRRGADITRPDGRMNTAADLADKDHPRLADFLRGENRQIEAEKAKPPEGWLLTAPDEVAHIEDKPAIGYRLTEIFNFGAGVYTRIARNMSTDQESQSMKLFEEMQGSQLLSQAADAFGRLGGDTGKLDAAMTRLDKKPAGLAAFATPKGMA